MPVTGWTLVACRRARESNGSVDRWQAPATPFPCLILVVLRSSTGGVPGADLGMAVSHLMTRFFTFPTVIQPWSPVLAFAVSVAVGLISGTYLARRATMMDPIEALRHA